MIHCNELISYSCSLRLIWLYTLVGIDRNLTNYTTVTHTALHAISLFSHFVFYFISKMQICYRILIGKKSNKPKYR